jgi:hypothetical protein
VARAPYTTSPTPLAKYRYRRRLPHLQKGDAAMFVIFCVSTRLPLPEEARDLVLQHCLRDHGKRIYLYAVVVVRTAAPWLIVLFTPSRVTH